MKNFATTAWHLIETETGWKPYLAVHHTTVMGGVNSNTELVKEQTTVVEHTQTPRPAIEQILPGYKQCVKWPDTAEKNLWEMLNNDLIWTFK